MKWFEALSDADLAARFENLVPDDKRGMQKTCAFEVLVFHTRVEWEQCDTEKEYKTKIFAKFRCYDHAERYAQSLLLLGPSVTYYHKVLLRV